MNRKLLAILFLLFSSFVRLSASGVPVEIIGNVPVTGPEFTLNPNPVNGAYFYVNLKFSETEYPDAVVIVNDILGKSVFTYVIKKSDFMEGRVRIGVMEALLDKGIYFIQVKSGEATKTLKLAIR